MLTLTSLVQIASLPAEDELFTAKPFAEFVRWAHAPKDGAPNEVVTLAETRTTFLWRGSTAGLALLRRLRWSIASS